jgi:hypothetical protein
MVGRKNALIVRKVSNPFSLLLSTGQPKPTAVNKIRWLPEEGVAA